MNPRNSSIQPSRQRGAALVVGLVLLLILTLLGVSGLGTATTEVRLADNNKQREFAFQAADSGVSEAIQSGGLLVIDSSAVENQQVRDNNYEYDHADADGNVAEANVNVRVRTLYRGIGGPGAGNDLTRFEGVNFVAHGEATGARGARATVRQGYFYLAPKP